jgi:CheY-like chemotaxis protein
MQKHLPAQSALELPTLKEVIFDKGEAVRDLGKPQAQALKALVLDDNPQTVDKVAGLLRKQGFEVTRAQTLDEAKKKYSAGGDFSLVVSDLDVSEGFFDLRGRMGGYLFVKWLLEQGHTGMTVMHSTTLTTRFCAPFWRQ